MPSDADASEHIGTVIARVLVAAFVAAARDPKVRAALRELREEPTSHEADRLLTAGEVAKRLGVSVAHVRRLDPPAVVVGDASTKRYDLTEVRAWLDAREPKATTAAKQPAVDDLDVDAVVRAAGLRAVSGGRR